MSTQVATQQADGMCAAFGCPLFGSMGTETNGVTKWLCSCHFRASGRNNDAVTSILRRDDVLPICNATLAIRRSVRMEPDEWNAAKLTISRGFKAAGIAHLLPGSSDIGLQGWLLRLELHLEKLTQQAAQKKLVEPEKVAVIGPTHVATHLPYADQEGP